MSKYATRSRKRRESTQQNAQDQAASQATGGKRSESFWDKLDANHDGKIDADDFLVGLRSVWNWFVSHRFGMVVYLGLAIISACLNVQAWTRPLSGLGALTGIASFLVWGTFQYQQLAPKLDELNLKASLEALIRKQRKPLEVPVINPNLYSNAMKYQRKYRSREERADLWAEIRRWISYLSEGAILIAGGGLLTALGVSWGAIVAAVIGMCGVEWGVTGFCQSAEKVLDKEEREYMQRILQMHSRQTVTAGEADQAA